MWDGMGWDGGVLKPETADGSGYLCTCTIRIELRFYLKGNV